MRRRRLPPSLDWRTFKSFVPLPTFANRPLKFAFKVMLSCLWSLQAHATRINNHVRLRRRPLCPKMALSTYEEASEARVVLQLMCRKLLRWLNERTVPDFDKSCNGAVFCAMWRPYPITQHREPQLGRPTLLLRSDAQFGTVKHCTDC